MSGPSSPGSSVMPQGMPHIRLAHGQLRAQVRAAAGRDAQPTAAVIDSQSVRAAGTVPRASRGWDAAKKVNGRKRHIAVDTTGLLLDVVITAASVQDRDAARPLLWNTHRACPRVTLAWADSGYHAHALTTWATARRITLQIVRRPDDLHTFTVLPRPLGSGADPGAPRGALSYPRFSREGFGGRFLGRMAYLDPKG
jgi:Transposase DDE domain